MLDPDPTVNWFGELLWSAWAAATTVGGVAFILATGTAVFLLLVGGPHAWGRRRRRKRLDAAMAKIPPERRDGIYRCLADAAGPQPAVTVWVPARGEPDVVRVHGVVIQRDEGEVRATADSGRDTLRAVPLPSVGDAAEILRIAPQARALLEGFGAPPEQMLERLLDARVIEGGPRPESGADDEPVECAQCGRPMRFLFQYLDAAGERSWSVMRCDEQHPAEVVALRDAG